MATIIFGAVGSLIGGPIGGGIGALLGRQVDGVLIGNGNRDSGRLSDLTATTSTYGDPIPQVFGRMRMPGSIIWSTDLVEHSTRASTSKSSATVTTYTYTVSFAVALSSRPIVDVGRVWADGNLMRGVAGDLKVGGSMRIYTGRHDQAPDPLIAGAEGAGRAPAHRGLAYVVFEDLDLSTFYNRIPTLNFEVIADDGALSLAQVLAGVDGLSTAVTLNELVGLSSDRPYQDLLSQLDPFYPMACDAGGAGITIARELYQTSSLALGEAAVSVRDDAFGGASGFAHNRSPVLTQPPEILRYYDIDRDYQPGLQRALGRSGPGQPHTTDFPVAMNAINARALVERMARKADWSRDTIAWRTTEVDTDVAPGSVVTIPGQDGRWRVADWEWRDGGVEMTLTRVVPTGADPTAFPADAGRALVAVDAAIGTTLLDAFELPWDGSGTGDVPLLFAAVSSAGAAWQGAALSVDHGDGNLVPLGSSGRARAIVGACEGVLAPANPLLIDRASTLTVHLAQDAMALANADGRQLAMGANQALVGSEIVQFATATPLGGGRWALGDLLRGRGGTESAVSRHAVSEPFVLLDGAPVDLDAAIVGTGPATIVAAGLGDATPVTSSIGLRGISQRPLSPVHPKVVALAGGGLALGWTRRARAAWTWDDGVDVPLHEETEVYRVDYGDLDLPVSSWIVNGPQLQLDAATIGQLIGRQPGGALHVRQQGSYALSEPLYLTSLS